MSYRTRLRVYLVLIVAGLGIVAWLYWDRIGQYRHTLAADRAQEYWLYAPDRCTGEVACPAFVFVHGTGGNGQIFIKLWRGFADEEGFVLVSPTFPLGYQTLDGGEDKKLIAILDEVGQRYAITGKAFVSGFSGGAQFAHRFAFAHPERTLAVAAHSAGWYDPPPVSARGVPFLVTVGLDDGERIEMARWFVRSLKREGYDARLVELKGVGHHLSVPAVEETLALFRRVSR